MALIKCSECGQDVSTNAKACPGCGNRKISISTRKSFFSTILVSTILVAIIVGCFYSILKIIKYNRSFEPTSEITTQEIPVPDKYHRAGQETPAPSQTMPNTNEELFRKQWTVEDDVEYKAGAGILKVASTTQNNL